MTTVGRWSPNKVRARVLDGTWATADDFVTGNGMALLTPTSVEIIGGGSETATTLPNGSVQFTDCQVVALDGIFSSTFDNYLIQVHNIGATSLGLRFQFRSSGSNIDTNTYVRQSLEADSTTVSAARSTSTNAVCGYSATTANGSSIFVYGPHLASPTAMRNCDASGASYGTIYDWACTESTSASYDGCRIYRGGGTMSGLVSVYGLVGA